MTAAWPTTASPPQLAAGELHVWRARIDELAQQLAALRAALPPDERERAEQFRMPLSQARFIVARALTRWLIGHYLDVAPSAIRFAIGPIGKLHLPWPEPLHFNATHSGQVVLVAIARDGDVGVDVEHLRPLPKFQELAERYYCQREIATLSVLPEEQRQRAFFLAWTRKEALLKGVGKGLTFPLCDVEVTLAPGEPAKLLQFGAVAGEHAPWKLAHLDPAEDYVGAVATTQPTTRLHQFHWNALGESFLI